MGIIQGIRKQFGSKGNHEYYCLGDERWGWRWQCGERPVRLGCQTEATVIEVVRALYVCAARHMPGVGVERGACTAELPDRWVRLALSPDVSDLSAQVKGGSYAYAKPIQRREI